MQGVSSLEGRGLKGEGAGDIHASRKGGARAKQEVRERDGRRVSFRIRMWRRARADSIAWFHRLWR